MGPGYREIVDAARAALADGPVLVSVQVEHKPDECPNLDHLGTYSNEPGPADRTVDRGERGPREYRYFIAANSSEETGNSDSVQQDYWRMEAYNNQQWYMMGVYAVAEVRTPTPQGGYSSTQHIRTPGLWGIESDSGTDYIKEVGQEQLDDLREHLGHFGVDLGNWDALTVKA
ncbi:hypothetical protein IMZ48_08260 [Candidatus Bathyarchaeota archaeon]|nr:hypothetical protein [Candidatus Bathyarchaeota archaeon]